jgi:hypothetical protein
MRRILIFLRRVDERLLPPIGRALSGLRPGSLRMRVAMVVGSVLSLMLVLLTVYAATRLPLSQTAASTSVRKHVGVVAGQSIPEYVRQARARLDAQVAGGSAGADGSVMALVSLSDYATPEDLDSLARGARVLTVYAHVFVPGARTDILAFQGYADLADAMRDVARDNARNAKDYRRLQQLTTGDGVDEQTLRKRYARAETLQKRQAKAYGSLCACVFAFVVCAPPATLAALAAHARVRAVDPVAGADRVDDIDFAAPRPEETTRADGQDGVAVASSRGP